MTEIKCPMPGCDGYLLDCEGNISVCSNGECPVFHYGVTAHLVEPIRAVFAKQAEEIARLRDERENSIRACQLVTIANTRTQDAIVEAFEHSGATSVLAGEICAVLVKQAEEIERLRGRIDSLPSLTYQSSRPGVGMRTIPRHVIAAIDAHLKGGA